MPDQASSERRAFRDAVGRFATGVTIITVADGGRPYGMTANAFSSLSLDPPLVLFCVDKAASAYEPIQRSGAFAVNILAEHQQPLSDFFARHGREEKGDPMGGFPHRSGKTGSPILDSTLGWLDCRVTEQLDGGDHSMVIGEVIDLELSEPSGSPLLFFAGGYRKIGDPA